MFEIFQKVATTIATTVLTLIQATFGIQNLGIADLPLPSDMQDTVTQEESPITTPSSKLNPSPLTPETPSEKPTPTPTPKVTPLPTAQPAVTPTPIAKTEKISITWHNVVNQGSYGVSDTIPVEVNVNSNDISKVEFSVGSDYHVCTVTQKPYTCPLELQKFFHGITGKQHFPIEVKAYQVDGTLHRNSITVYVLPN